MSLLSCLGRALVGLDGSLPSCLRQKVQNGAADVTHSRSSTRKVDAGHSHIACRPKENFALAASWQLVGGVDRGVQKAAMGANDPDATARGRDFGV